MACFREFHGIPYQVGQDLKNAIVVRFDHRIVAKEFSLEFDLLGFCRDLKGIENLLGEIFHVDRLFLERHFSGFDLGSIQEVLDELYQPVHGVDTHVQDLLLAFRDGAQSFAQHSLYPRFCNRKRRLELMQDHRRKLAFDLV